MTKNHLKKDNNYEVFNIILILFFFTSTLAQNDKRKVKIIKIDSTKSYYFIKGKFKCKPKSEFIIVSKRDTTIVGKEKIKIKKIYRLKLTSYLVKEQIDRLPSKLKGTLLLREDGYIIWDGESNLPYKSSDIKSLFLNE